MIRVCSAVLASADHGLGMRVDPSLAGFDRSLLRRSMLGGAKACGLPTSEAERATTCDAWFGSRDGSVAPAAVRGHESLASAPGHCDPIGGFQVFLREVQDWARLVIVFLV